MILLHRLVIVTKQEIWFTMFAKQMAGTNWILSNGRGQFPSQRMLGEEFYKTPTKCEINQLLPWQISPKTLQKRLKSYQFCW